jgi:catechol 2,3-dioxygenase-like lactoylglutathione lyase family enzyme
VKNDEKIFALTLFVADLEASKNFYRSAFGKEVVFQDPNSAVFQFGEVLLNLLQQQEAPGLIAPERVATKESGSRFQLTIHVDDIDARISQLAAAGISLVNGPIQRPWGPMTALISDPDGHLWEIAQ